MTVIECYSRTHIDNLAACLYLKAEKLIMLGDLERMKDSAGRYEQILRDRGLDTEIVLYDARQKSAFDICALLQRLIQQEGDCVIDLTGGDETVVLATGAALARLPEELRGKVQVQKYLHTKGEIRNCIDPSLSRTQQYIPLSVEEQLRLYGGVLCESVEPAGEDSHAKELNALWELVCNAPRDWNRRIGLLRELESHSTSEKKNHIYLELRALQGQVKDLENKEKQARQLLTEMDRCGVIEDRSSRDVLSYTYRSDLLRQGTKKEGNVLELKTLLESRAIREKGKSFFQSSRMGVTIDWDGVRHTHKEGIHDTSNEIDVLLMRGTVPLFISCKNGNVDENELYKLHTVATRFGGPYARKILIATDLDGKRDPARRALIQRAEDMRIKLITDVAELSWEQWQDMLKKCAE